MIHRRRFDFDGTFYRVLCVTLLAIALTFTVILTNVFVDIDGLLAGKIRDKATQTTVPPEVNLKDVELNQRYQAYRSEEFEDKFYGKDDNGDNYRNKRSLDTTKIRLRIKNPKMKTILTNQLNSLLEELDAEEMETERNEDEVTEKPVGDIEKKTKSQLELFEETTPENKEDKDLHQEMHKILVEGIYEHMEVNKVYNKVHSLIDNYLKEQDSKNVTKENDKTVKAKDDKDPTLSNVEAKFFDELMKCKELQHEISDVPEKTTSTPLNASNPENLNIITRKDNMPLVLYHKTAAASPKMLIKTIIDITSLKNDNKENNISSNENIRGLIKVIYNGKSVPLNRLDEETATVNNVARKHAIVNTPKYKTMNPTISMNLIDSNNPIQKSAGNKLKQNQAVSMEGQINLTEALISKALREYVKNHLHKLNKKKNKRPKRDVKLKVIDNENTHTESLPRYFKSDSKSKVRENKESKEKKDEEELYVEIETHFDTKGIEGAKKKKLIHSIVEKIQNAIHSNIDSVEKTKKTNNKNENHDKNVKKAKQEKHATFSKIKKRYQNPLVTELKNKLELPLKVVNRQSEPVGKIVILTDNVLKVKGNTGESWQYPKLEPNVLSNTKSINSGELSHMNLEYDKVRIDNEIPQRLQQPLNPEFVDENGNAYFDIGNMKFYIKDLEGTGFSIGFNQYVGEAPDPDSIKVFTGVQQLLNRYPEAYEINEAVSEPSTEDINSSEHNHAIVKRHIYKKRRIPSQQEEMNRREGLAHFDDDYHFNAYKFIFDKRYIKDTPFSSYKQILFKDTKKDPLNKNKKVDSKNPKQSLDFISLPATDHNNNYNSITNLKTHELILSGDVFRERLNPNQIFGLANLLQRKKRSFSLNRYTKRSETKFNRHSKSHSKSARPYFHNKRTKRQLNKIRIIASDSFPPMANSEENIYVVSGENILADRAILRDTDMPEVPENVLLEKPAEDRLEFLTTLDYEQPKNPYESFFTSKSRNNILMSKYPHILMEEISKYKEDDSDEKVSSKMFGKYLPNIPSYRDYRTEATTPNFQVPGTDMDIPGPEVQSIANAIDPHTNYKLTVKIIPKNETDVHSGYKEIHTTINKSVNKNGVVFSSQVNISELSKIDNFEKESQMVSNYGNNNNTKIIGLPAVGDTTMSPLLRHLREQQERLKKLLRQHTIKIDEQLNHLKNEKQNIERIIVPKEEEKKKSETIDVILPLNPPRLLQINKDEAGKLLSSAIMKLHDIPEINEVANHSCNRSESVIKTDLDVQPKVTTTVYTSTLSTPNPNIPRIDPDRVKILRTIQRNENLTHAILTKIDKNTDLLQKFLQKLMERMEPTTTTAKEDNIDDQYTTIAPRVYGYDWNRPNKLEAYFNGKQENERNETDVAIPIPFVYAYQPPYPIPLKAKLNPPVANVIYPGLIHSNDTKPTISEIHNMMSNRVKRNQTRFFIDDLDPMDHINMGRLHGNHTMI